VNLAELERNLTAVMPVPCMLQVSSTTGAGIGDWVQRLRGAGDSRSASGVAVPAAGRVV